MGKSFSRFLPTPSRSPEECERHYTAVHVRMAQDLLRPMPALVSYHVNRAVAQADVVGGWEQRPRPWRFVVLRFQEGEALAFSAEQNEMVAQDHVNCLYRLRHCDVEETVLLDRRGDQLDPGQVPARGRPRARRRRRRRLGGVQRAGGPPPRADGGRVRRAVADPQPRAVASSSASPSTSRASGRSGCSTTRPGWATWRSTSTTRAGAARPWARSWPTACCGARGPRRRQPGAGRGARGAQSSMHRL